MQITKLLITLSALAFSANGAFASSSLGPASAFNVFILGNDTQSNTDAQGAVGVGGNAVFTNYSVASNLNSSYNGSNTLVVGNTLNYNNGQVFYGNGAIGATSGNSINANFLNGTYTTGIHPIDFGSAGSALKSESTYLQTFGGTVETPTYGAYTLNGTNNTRDFFSVDAAGLSSANGLTINGKTGETVVVNISGTAATLQNFQINLNNIDPNHVLYNFSEASTLGISSLSPEGTVLAPFANISFSNGHIDGTIIGASLSGSGEEHQFAFEGNVPTPHATAAPEPASVATMGLGMFGIFGMAFRRRLRKMA